LVGGIERRAIVLDRHTDGVRDVLANETAERGMEISEIIHR
jgi:hypothetical protein